MNYELSFIISSAIPETEHDKVQQEILSYIEKTGAKISKQPQVIGRRKLAYPIKKQKHGFYVFLEFEAEDKTGFVDMETKIKHNPGILRHLLIKKDVKVSATPSEAKQAKPTKPAFEAKPVLEEKPVEEKPQESEAKPAVEDIKLDLGDIDKRLDEILGSDPKVD